MSGAPLPLALDLDWTAAPWVDRLVGAGVTAVANGVLTTTGGVGDAAFRDFWLPVLPGMRVEVEFMARKVSGDPTGTGLFFDLLAHDQTAIALVEQVDISGNDWKQYKAAYTVPLNTPALARFLRLGFGVRTAFIGDARFQLPIVRVGRGFAVPVVLARGLARVTGGVASLLAGFPSFGVASVAFNGTTTLTVNLSHAIPSNPSLRPLVHLNAGGNHFFLPIVATVAAGAAPSFTVVWSNGAAIQNVNAVAQNLDVYFEVLW